MEDLSIRGVVKAIRDIPAEKINFNISEEESRLSYEKMINDFLKDTGYTCKVLPMDENNTWKVCLYPLKYIIDIDLKELKNDRTVNKI